MAGSPRALPRHALLIVDLISRFDFEDGAALLRQSMRALPAVLRLREAFDAAGWPVLYGNDNFGRWRSDFKAVLANCLAADSPGRKLAEAVRPRPSDIVVLKPMHSAFFCTPLELVLRSLRVRRLVLAGTAGDGCITATVLDAHMRHYEVRVAGDATASVTAARNARALAQLQASEACQVASSRQIIAMLPRRRGLSEG
jgi:nicotinamidase-related amidase